VASSVSSIKIRLARHPIHQKIAKNNGEASLHTLQPRFRKSHKKIITISAIISKRKLNIRRS
jgi:hypothetical protein